MKLQRNMKSAGIKILFVIIMASCIQFSTNSSIWDSIFRSMEANIDTHTESSFCNARIDWEDASFRELYEVARSEIPRLPKDDDIRRYLDSLFVVEDLSSRAILVTVAFYHNCLYDTIAFNLVKKDYYKILDQKYWIEYGRAEFEKKHQISIQNDSLIRVGDTIEVELSVSDRFGKPMVYYSLGIPDTIIDIGSIDLEPLYVRGYIVEKKYGELYPSGLDTTDLIFMLKILEISNTEVLVSWAPRNVGDTLPFHVSEYGRLLR